MAFYLVCYDIVKDSRRNKVAHLLEGYGLRVQKSVFEVVLDEQQYEKLQKRLLKYLNQREDQLRFYPLSARNRSKVLVLGVQPEFAVDDAAFIV
ncbi:CRISPR-associated endonuclease Cas2 [Allocoleopsis franciscana]|uniref:CRISPR-associated endoribonuclease Cas2 n=1 Tax=Allocoleopsis franciscana PCC 7113 TaxID=1173027 RepID=K9WP46_9CYAN|nr:CRISPR-associated endonuclease Cas2 [Allocoleopsis franciscana]AFZ22160.1 CRISPR-associated endoribonuclease Cas2 [Allocoleopsis franciscana PCC 7113]